MSNCNSQAKCIHALADNNRICIEEVPRPLYAFWICKPVVHFLLCTCVMIDKLTCDYKNCNMLFKQEQCIVTEPGENTTQYVSNTQVSEEQVINCTVSMYQLYCTKCQDVE